MIVHVSSWLELGPYSLMTELPCLRRGGAS